MDLDNGIVGWESQDDPLNPRYVLREVSALKLADIRFRNFPERQKWTLLAFVSLISFLRFVILFQNSYNEEFKLTVVQSFSILHLRPGHFLH